jgi:hypothetical protein
MRVKEEDKEKMDGQDRVSHLNSMDETLHSLRARGSPRLYFDECKLLQKKRSDILLTMDLNICKHRIM